MAERILAESGIYAIRNIKTGKIYIGQSVSVAKRIGTHKWMLKNGKHSSRHLQRAYDLDGVASFQFCVLEYCEKELLTPREQHWMDSCRAHGLYNSAPAAGSNSGFRHSPETILAMSIARKGCAPGMGRLGAKNTPEARAKVSRAMKGRKASEETRRKLSEMRKGRKLSAEHKAKMSASLKGLPKSEEWRRKMSEINKGKVMSAEAREKMRLAQLGTKQSPELIARRIAASVAAKKAKRQAALAG